MYHYQVDTNEFVGCQNKLVQNICGIILISKFSVTIVDMILFFKSQQTLKHTEFTPSNTTTSSFIC